MLNNCIIIGDNSEINLTEADGYVIIGDNIKFPDNYQKDKVIFIGRKFIVGETVFGSKVNLKDVLIKSLKLY